MSKALKQLNDALERMTDPEKFHVPGLWLGHNDGSVHEVSYRQWVQDAIQQALDTGGHAERSHNGTGQVVYNLLVRFFSAFDHDQDGKLGEGEADTTCNAHGLRETGTFVKTIALLPYLLRLGINTLHLLPVTAIGHLHRKGDLGSPYAIKDHFALEPTLADPLIELDIQTQFKALVEAAHLMGMRVIGEFILRTSAIDNVWIPQQPQWFYWHKRDVDFYPPAFDAESLEKIMKVPEGKGEYIAPTEEYRSNFTTPPAPDHVYTDEQGRYVANIDGVQTTVPGAFADWPPDDRQPPWTDVTYLRLYEYPESDENDFNYIAYNTIRFYDPELAQSENEQSQLWEKLLGVIPHFQKQYNIDGAMIDMGHALPERLKVRMIASAREINPDFTFWDENFDNKEGTMREGYNAVIGDGWYHITTQNGFQKIIDDGLKELPLPYFGTAESHNTPRFGHDQLQKKKAAWAVHNFLPRAIPFLHQGYELNEYIPVNTGLNFDEEALAHWKDKPLPLFHKAALDWTSPINIVAFIQSFAQLRKDHPGACMPGHVYCQECDNPQVVVVIKENKNGRYMLVLNCDFHHAQSIQQCKPSGMGKIHDLMNDNCHDGEAELTLQPGEFLIFSW
jgi:glycosidase